MRPKLLFVDDEPNVRRGLQRMLWDYAEEWDIRFACDAAEALLMMDTEPFDVLVTDHNMPGASGIELIEKVQAIPDLADIPIIMLTGCNDRTLKRRALDAGATDLLSKPIDQEDLLARLNSVIRLKKSQDQLAAKNEELETLVRERTRQLEESRLEVVWRLSKAAETRDVETGNHTLRVGFYSQITAHALGLDQDFQEAILLAAPLHDIGKLAIPDEILQKQGPLTAAEFELMKTHTTIGHQILLAKYSPPKSYNLDFGGKSVGRSPFIEMAARIALQHHEKWDGTGYPSQLSGENISLEARIVAVADVYDALRSARPYKPAMSEEQAIEVLQRGKQKHFDKPAVEAFLDSLQTVRGIALDLADEFEYVAA